MVGLEEGLICGKGRGRGKSPKGKHVYDFQVRRVHNRRVFAKNSQFFRKNLSFAIAT
jgi:hypothetical protein